MTWIGIEPTFECSSIISNQVLKWGKPLLFRRRIWLPRATVFFKGVPISHVDKYMQMFVVVTAQLNPSTAKLNFYVLYYNTLRYICQQIFLKSLVFTRKS